MVRHEHEKLGRMIEEIEQTTSGSKDLLQSKGIGDSAKIANLLVQQAQRYWARRR
jgi:hypothetical protein